MICDYTHKNICICVTGLSENLETDNTFVCSTLMTIPNPPNLLSSILVSYHCFNNPSQNKHHKATCIYQGSGGAQI